MARAEPVEMQYCGTRWEGGHIAGPSPCVHGGGVFSDVDLLTLAIPVRMMMTMMTTTMMIMTLLMLLMTNNAAGTTLGNVL